MSDEDLINTAKEISEMKRDKELLEKDRRTGRTTRLVDAYIQELFNNPGKWVNIIDHYGTPNSNVFCYHAVLKRLRSEHDEISGFFDFDRKQVRIKLINDPKKHDEIFRKLTGK